MSVLLSKVRPIQGWIQQYIYIVYIVFLRDVTVAILLFLNKGRAAMLVFPVNPPEIKFYSYANVSLFLFWWKNMLINHVSENTIR